MHGATVMTNWKRLTDRMKSLWVDRAKDAGAKTSGAALGHEACGTVAVEKSPTVLAAMLPHAERDDDPRAAPLTAWKNKGSSISKSAQAPLRKV